MDEKAKKNQSLRMKERWKDPEYRKHMSNILKGVNHHMYGKHHSKETKKKISESSRGRKASKELRDKLSKMRKGKGNPMYGRRGLNNPLYGRPFSLEHKRKISEAHKGKVVSKVTRRRISKARKGEKNPRWKGGRMKQERGYILVHSPDHAFKNCMGYIREHRLIMEQWLRENEPNHPALTEVNGKKYLKSNWVVHHINSVKCDNRIENLEVLTASQHSKLHGNPFSNFVDSTNNQRVNHYIPVSCHNHPMSNTRGYIFEHRLIIEQQLKETNPNHPSLVDIAGEKYLSKDWVVHHINGVKDDNELDNLQVMTVSKHRSFHMNCAWKNKKEEEN